MLFSKKLYVRKYAVTGPKSRLQRCQPSMTAKRVIFSLVILVPIFCKGKLIKLGVKSYEMGFDRLQSIVTTLKK